MKIKFLWLYVIMMIVFLAIALLAFPLFLPRQAEARPANYLTSAGEIPPEMERIRYLTPQTLTFSHNPNRIIISHAATGTLFMILNPTTPVTRTNAQIVLASGEKLVIDGWLQVRSISVMFWPPLTDFADDAVYVTGTSVGSWW